MQLLPGGQRLIGTRIYRLSDGQRMCGLLQAQRTVADILATWLRAGDAGGVLQLQVRFWGPGPVPRLGAQIAQAQALQVNGHLRDLGVCKWRRLREGAQPGKVGEVQNGAASSAAKSRAACNRRRSAMHSWRRRGGGPDREQHIGKKASQTTSSDTLPTWPRICKVLPRKLLQWRTWKAH